MNKTEYNLINNENCLKDFSWKDFDDNGTIILNDNIAFEYSNKRDLEIKIAELELNIIKGESTPNLLNLLSEHILFTPRSKVAKPIPISVKMFELSKYYFDKPTINLEEFITVIPNIYESIKKFCYSREKFHLETSDLACNINLEHEVKNGVLEPSKFNFDNEAEIAKIIKNDVLKSGDETRAIPAVFFLKHVCQPLEEMFIPFLEDLNIRKQIEVNFGNNRMFNNNLKKYELLGLSNLNDLEKNNINIELSQISTDLTKKLIGPFSK